jgi:DNA-binding response OmpR family regulator
MLPKNKKTILLVEDEEDIRDIYKTKLVKAGYGVAVANSGTKGVDLARKKKPDLILLDIVLPMGEGFSVLEDLKKNSRTKNIPVIILSNLDQDYEKKMARDMGAEEYLTKTNVTPEEVVETIKNIFGKK